MMTPQEFASLPVGTDLWWVRPVEQWSSTQLPVRIEPYRKQTDCTEIEAMFEQDEPVWLFKTKAEADEFIVAETKAQLVRQIQGVPGIRVRRTI